MNALFAMALTGIIIWLCVLHNTIKNQEKLISHLQEQLNKLNGEPEKRRNTFDVPERQQISVLNELTENDAPPAIRTERYKYRVEKDSLAKKDSASIENWLGRNVLGIAASALIFLGLIFLGILVYDYLTEMLKLIIMYSISVLLTVLGIFFTNRKRNAFTVILTGCGCGSLFISILLTHIYFNYIGDIAAFSMLAVWMAGALYLAKRLDSLLVSVIAHIGMIFSICFAFATGMNDDKLAVVLIYQAVSTAVILLGNILCFKKTYRFGLIISLFLSVAASVFMTFRFTWGGYYGDVPFPATSINTATLTFAFALQFICASFLSYLLAVSASRLKDKTFKAFIHVINKILWTAALSVNITHIAYRIAYFSNGRTSEGRYDAMFKAVGISLIFLIIHAILSIIMSHKLNFNGTLETISVLIASFTTGIMLLILWTAGRYGVTTLPNLIGFILVGIMMILAGKICGNKAYKVAGNIFAAADLIFMLAGGYRDLELFGSIALPLTYLLLFLTVIWIQWLLEEKDQRIRLLPAARASSLIVAEISLITIFVMSSLQYKGTILLLVLTVLNCLLYLFKYDSAGSAEPTPITTLLWVNEIIIVAVNSFAIAFMPKTSTVLSVLYFLLAVFTVCLAFLRIAPVLKGEGGTARELLAGLKVSVLVLALINGNTNWFDYTYIFSLICMVTALICIAAGFTVRAKTLRLYGLVLTLVCVLKLVTVDVSSLNTVLRVVSLIGGGGICFIISALYNYSVKKFQF